MNQNPEQIARDRIDHLLRLAGWIVQNKRNIDLNASLAQGYFLAELQYHPTNLQEVVVFPKVLAQKLVQILLS
jgi:hypothetical protein